MAKGARMGFLPALASSWVLKICRTVVPAAARMVPSSRARRASFSPAATRYMIRAVPQPSSSGTRIVTEVVSGPATTGSRLSCSVTHPAAVPNTSEAAALTTRATPSSSSVPTSRRICRTGFITSGPSCIMLRMPSRMPLIQPRDVNTVTTAAIPAAQPRLVGVQQLIGINQPLAAVDLQQAGRGGGHALDDLVQQGRMAAEDQAGQGQAGGQQACDGEEHPEPDAGAQSAGRAGRR